MTDASATFWQTSFEQHGSALMAFLTSRVGRRDVAEDLLQETFVRVMRTPTALRDAEKVRSYLFSTAWRLVLNLGRRRRPLLFSELGSARRAAPLEVVDAESATPEEVADLGRLRERLDEILGRMPQAHRRAFRLAVLEQCSYAEVAAAEGWSVDQVRMNVYRGRKRVLEELKELLRVETEPVS